MTLLLKIKTFGAEIKGKKGVYCLKYNNGEYMLLINDQMQLCSLAKYVCKNELRKEQFEEALGVVQHSYPNISGEYDETSQVAYMSTPDLTYSQLESMTKEEFDSLVGDFDDAHSIMLATLFAVSSIQNNSLWTVRKQVLEAECLKYVENSIAEICENLCNTINSPKIERQIKRKLGMGQNEVRKELIEVPEPILIESIYFSVKQAFKRGRYEFGVGLKMKEDENDRFGAITYSIAYSDSFDILRSKTKALLSAEKVSEMLKSIVTRQIYQGC